MGACTASGKAGAVQGFADLFRCVAGTYMKNGPHALARTGHCNHLGAELEIVACRDLHLTSIARIDAALAAEGIGEVMLVGQVQAADSHFPRTELACIACVDGGKRWDFSDAGVAEIAAITLAVHPLCADVCTLTIFRYPRQTCRQCVLGHQYHLFASIAAV